MQPPSDEAHGGPDAGAGSPSDAPAVAAPEAMVIERAAPAQGRGGARAGAGRPSSLKVAAKKSPSCHGFFEPRQAPPNILGTGKRRRTDELTGTEKDGAAQLEDQSGADSGAARPEDPSGTVSDAVCVADLSKQITALSLSVQRIDAVLVDGGVLKSIKGATKESVGLIDAAYDKAKDKIADMQGLLVAHTRLQVLAHEDSALSARGRVSCALCSENSDTLTSKLQLKSLFLRCNGGYDQNDSDLVQFWNKHLNSQMHALCCEAAAAKALSPMSTALADAALRRDATLDVLFRAMAYAEKEKNSYASYERLVTLLYELDVDVGDWLHGSDTAREMAETLAEVGRDGLKNFLTTPSVITKRLPHVGASMDKVTLFGRQYQLHMVKVNHEGTPLTLFASVDPVEITVEEDGTKTEHEANGWACFTKICRVMERYGVPLFEVERRSPTTNAPTKYGDAIHVATDTSRPHTQQYRSTATDGEACYAGAGVDKSVRARLVGEHGLNDATHTHVHDPAHAEDLLISDAHERASYAKTVVHPLIKGVYGLFSGSPHKWRHMKMLVDEWGADDLWREIHYLFAVRFVQSEYTAVLNFLQSMPAIVAALQAQLDNEKDPLPPELRTKVAGWVRQMREFKFVAYLIVLVDVHKVNKVFSQRVQSDKALVIDLPVYREDYKRSLVKLRTTLGTEGERRIESLSKGQLCMSDGDTMSIDLDVEREVVGAMTVVRASGDVKTRLLGYQGEFLDAILDGFDDRMKEVPVAKLLAKVFDFRKMPLQFTASADALLETWGDTELEELCDGYFPELVKYDVVVEAHVMRLYAREHAAAFTVDGKLVMTGPGSIFEALFSRTDVTVRPGGIPSILHIADFMISFMFHSCNTERAGSHLTALKPKGRSLLGDESLNNSMFNTMNLPELHELDLEPVRKRWKADGRKDATFKGADTPTISKVVARRRALTTPTFLWK